MTGSLARRYARALLELAREAGTLDATGQELAAVAAAFDEPRLRAVVLNPAVDGGARRRGRRRGDRRARRVAVGRQSGERSSPTAIACRSCSQVAQAYDELVDAELGRTRVRIRVGDAAGRRREDRADRARETPRRANEVVVTTEVDPELLGGVVVDIGGTVCDGSLRTQLARISKDMAGSGA